ncbi:hypothetical protein QTP88_008597 [Uroleucon formosanum]
MGGRCSFSMSLSLGWQVLCLTRKIMKCCLSFCSYKDKSRICQYHFKNEDILHTWLSGQGVSKYTICLKRPKLCIGAVPIKFELPEITCTPPVLIIILIVRFKFLKRMQKEEVLIVVHKYSTAVIERCRIVLIMRVIFKTCIPCSLGNQYIFNRVSNSGYYTFCVSYKVSVTDTKQMFFLIKLKNFNMMHYRLICLFCSVLSGIYCSDTSYDSISDVYLEHELIPNAGFTKRSSILVNLESRNDVVSTTTINDSDIQLLKQLASKNELYRLKVTVRTLSGKETSFLTFTRACLIVGSKLNDILTLHLDHLDSPFAVNLATTSNNCNSFNELDTSNFTTTVFFRRPENSPVPDTATYIQKMERERDAREKGKSSNNKSMLGKYWMYILPLVIFMMIAGASNPEARQ